MRGETGGELSRRFGDAYAKRAPTLTAVAYRLLRDWQLAEDVVADVFLALHRRLGGRLNWDDGWTWNGRALHLDAWLHRCVTNRCIDLLRSMRRRSAKEFEDPTGCDTSADVSESVRLELADCWAKLGRDHPKWAVVAWRAIALGEPSSDVADALGITDGAVRGRRTRALRWLRRCLATKGVTE